MLRIRLHGRGGQGIKTAGQVLGTALASEGFEVQDAPRYGAERRGAPIVSYVRAGRAAIHERGVIARPDLVAVADETLVRLPAAAVLQGVAAHTVLLIVSDEPVSTWRERLGVQGALATLPVPADAGSAGIVCAGAAARLLGLIARDTLAAAIDEEFGAGAGFGADAIARARSAALDAFDALAALEGTVREAVEPAASDAAAPPWIDVPVDDAATASPDVVAAATSELAKTGAWRTMRPEIDDARCKRCSWVCSTLCPDSAIRVDADRRPHIDYDHCKGCLVCVAVCPAHAISVRPERRSAA
jgi:pyruvate ferredoxin oxidoreductase gamma subunit